MKILIQNETFETVIEVNEKTGDMFMKNPLYRESIINQINKENNTNFTVNDLIEDITSKHICKYCGNIVEGEYEDLLCDECREIFGHSLYSEL